jgi:uncharacterized lipoprotein YddW (UPF0748 family)
MHRNAWLFIVLIAAPVRAGEEKPVPREFRGVWIASVANIDWPSQKGLTTARQQAELRALFDKAAKLRLNAVILQVRPMADALYASKLEPWSEYLTGKLGQAPSPFYDPLEFAVREAHARGMELHAWFNPYRAWHPSATSAAADDHVVKSRPDLARPYGKHRWLNPTHKEVQDRSLSVFLDVVRRYDVDGIHIDDYFYPYKEKDESGKVIPFPDEDTWAEYQKSGGKSNKGDWRRDAVNRFVERMYKEVKAAKPWVKVGISPFGIWRPGHPPGIAGLDQYAELYADAKLWLNLGWCDYLSPQLYWPIKQEKQSYPRLLDWWVSENTKGRHIWPGNFTSRVTGGDKGWAAREIADQIKVTRGQRGASGNVHFSMKALMDNAGGIADTLAPLYAEAALVPRAGWAGLKAPAKPKIDWQDEGGKPALRIRPADEGIRLFVVRTRDGAKRSVTIHPSGGKDGITVPFAAPPENVRVSAVDRAGNESESAAATKDEG